MCRVVCLYVCLFQSNTLSVLCKKMVEEIFVVGKFVANNRFGGLVKVGGRVRGQRPEDRSGLGGELRILDQFISIVQHKNTQFS